MTLLTLDREAPGFEAVSPGPRTEFAAWLGHDAMIAADFVHRCGKGPFAFEVHFDAPADAVTIDLLDTQGLIVHSIEATAPGTPLACQWLGRSDGKRIEGPLRVRVVARASGRAVPTITNVWTPVTAIDAPAERSVTRLVTPNGAVAPDAVIRLA
jgi:flagellar basal-body rod modification protein FlgD